jgi:hypothetical protein
MLEERGDPGRERDACDVVVALFEEAGAAARALIALARTGAALDHVSAIGRTHLEPVAPRGGAADPLHVADGPWATLRGLLPGDACATDEPDRRLVILGSLARALTADDTGVRPPGHPTLLEEELVRLAVPAVVARRCDLGLRAGRVLLIVQTRRDQSLPTYRLLLSRGAQSIGVHRRGIT